jgi:hypothetical protein
VEPWRRPRGPLAEVDGATAPIRGGATVGHHGSISILDAEPV